MPHHGISEDGGDARQTRSLGTAEEALSANEQRLREILDAAPVAFISADVDGTILDWNAEAEHIFGWSRSEAVGHSFTETLMQPAVRSAYQHELSDLLASPDPKPAARRAELSMLRKSGQEFRVDVTLSRLSAGDGYLFRVFARDISTQRQAEEERRYTEELLAHQSLHDRLTGLPNRALLLDRIGHALALADRQKCLAALLYVDLDAFSLVNDSLGHQLGDELLVQVARRLQDVLRNSDTVSRVDGDTLARVGGDEFGVLCEALSSEQDAISIVDRITSTLEQPFAVGDDRVFVKLSIGIALSSPGATPSTLFRDADTAMNRAKERGGGRYELFDPETRARVLNRIRRENELRGALEAEQLRPYYQPIVSTVDGGMVGVEALLRWQHPEHGLCSPADFIPLAEETGLIIPIGRWILDQAWVQLAEWHDALGAKAPLHVSVNVSARQLVDDSIVTDVGQLIEQGSLNASQLILEVTESTLIDDTDERVAVLGRLKALGVRLALDDFGTGYSSLSYLRCLPFDVLKLDGSFVSGLGQTAADPQIVAAVIEMARALAMTVIAEGVETEEQLDHLRRAGCNYVQGHFFAAPMPAHELPAFLLTH